MSYLLERPSKVDFVNPAFEANDTEAVMDLVKHSGPYWSIAKYFDNSIGSEVFTGGSAELESAVYKVEWAGDETIRIPEAGPFFHYKKFIDLAKRTFDVDVVNPVYMYPGTWAPQKMTDPGHLDDAEFRGLNRWNYPIWVLTLMCYADIFEPWRVRTGALTIWFNRSERGDFRYWPNGPSGKEKRFRTVWNNAVFAETDMMFHCVGDVGSEDIEQPPREADGESEMIFRDDQWLITRDNKIVASYDEEQVRVNILWRARLFKDKVDADRYYKHKDDLTLERVLEMFTKDLEDRGKPYVLPSDPLHDGDWIRHVTSVYMPARSKNAA